MIARARPTQQKAEAGQSMVEFALVMPFVLLLALGVIEISHAIVDQHTVIRLTREGSNLISRDTTLLDAATAMRQMSTSPVNFDNGSSKLILSVIKRVGTIGSANYNRDVLYQRYEYGTFPGASALQTSGRGSFGPAPDFIAVNSDNDTSLRVNNLPPGLLTLGGLVYVTEIHTKHTLITPFDRFGVRVPNRLYSIAYF